MTPSVDDMPPRVLALDWQHSRRHTEPALRACHAEVIPADLTGPFTPPKPGAVDLAIVVDHYHPEYVLALADLRRAGVPSLLVMDGILDWFNTWDNPRYNDDRTGVPLLQPALTDRIACLGDADMRLLSSWGNAGRCERVGLTRLDELHGVKVQRQAVALPRRVLVATARHPAFTAAQRRAVIAGLLALRRWHDEQREQVEFVWRLTDGLAEEVGASDAPAAAPLREVLARVDAVVTTPSTLMLEAMVLDRPTAVLDFANRPSYCPAAWTITAEAHVGPVLQSLLDPCPRRMQWQRVLLHDAVVADGRATPRLAELITRMAVAARQARATDDPLKLPYPLLPPVPVDAASASVPASYDYAKLYPEHAVFGCRPQAELGVELTASRMMRQELEQQRGRISGYLRSPWRSAARLAYRLRQAWGGK